MHTVVPWNTEGATYATNYAGPNPYDVSYQTSTDLTGLGTKGVLEVLNTRKWLYSPDFKATQAKFIPAAIQKSTYQGKLYGLPCIIGGTVVYYNKDLLAKAGVTSIPTNTAQLAAAAQKVVKSGRQRDVGLPGPDDEQGLQLVLPRTTTSTTAAPTSSRKDGKRVTFTSAAATRRRCSRRST